MLSIVIPVYNERESLTGLHAELDEVARLNGYELDVIFVDDGSTDGSWKVIEQLADAGPARARNPLPPQLRQGRCAVGRFRQRAASG